jgi:hypothetical protein
MILFALVVPKTLHGFAVPVVFSLFAFESKLSTLIMKKPPALRAEGFVTPSGFKPETF